MPDKQQQGEQPQVRPLPFGGPNVVVDAGSAAAAASAAASLPQDEAGHVGAAAEHVVRQAAPAAATGPAPGAAAG